MVFYVRSQLDERPHLRKSAFFCRGIEARGQPELTALSM